ncbi:hypothetical protein KW850_31580 [Bacillus sp. sid0103]|uniref:hypothetical protein n=1 Tax=Bacillus sp. sid0103 TaxID=2856337 RepID=UPI001C439B07|nr:hypothetical protein [Bacillus sp. sid0103]MBV7509660.1 hypothetical protein [Bacillus sp. sid0103]
MSYTYLLMGNKEMFIDISDSAMRLAYPTTLDDDFYSFLASKANIYSSNTGTMIAGPIDATVQANGNWMMGDLSRLQLTVKGDFYIGYIQTTDFPFMPAISLDTDSQFFGHSYLLDRGFWSKGTYETGNIMIRAVMDYEADSPKITSPLNGKYTNYAIVKIDLESSIKFT